MCGYEEREGRRKMSDKEKRVNYGVDLTQFDMWRMNERDIIDI